jgi:hypothetical protein
MFDPFTAAIGIGGSLLSGAFGSIGAGQQADASRYAARMQADAARRAADLQNQQYQQTRQDLSPYMQAGQNALGGLGSVGLGSQFDVSSQYDPYQQYQASQGLPQFQGFGVSPESYYQQATMPFQFNPESDPGYQFRLQQGLGALEGSAAARGGLFSGQTGKDLTDYAQGMASQEYQNAFNRDLAQKQNLGQAYGLGSGQNLAQQQQGFNQDLTGRQFGSQEFYNAMGADQQNRMNAYNRLFGLAGMGQNAAAQAGQFGQNSASQIGNYGLGGAQALGAGGQQAAGYGAGALQNWGNQLGGLAGTYMNYNMLKNLMG